MAASSGLVSNSFAHKPCSIRGGVGAAFGSSSLLVRLCEGSTATAIAPSCRRCYLTTSQRHGGATFVSPRCRAGSNVALAFPEFERERCNFVVISLSGPNIPVETHEKLAIVESEWPRAIGQLCALHDIKEVAVLSTWGSRLDIYVLAVPGGNGVSQVTNWISKSRGVPASEIRKHSSVLYDKDAVEHLFKVSSGFLDSDSLVLDETQVLAQVKEASSHESRVVGLGTIMRRLFWHACLAGRRVARETRTTSSIFAVAAAGAAVELALMELSSPIDNARILVVGAGKMAALVIKRLVSRGCKKMVVIDDSEFIDMELTEEERVVEIIYKPESEMHECVAASDVVFTAAIKSKKPLFLKPQRQRQQRLVFIDMSVPRNVSPRVARSQGTVVYNVDDLNRVVYKDAVAVANNEDRLMKARCIIDEETLRFEAFMDLKRGEHKNADMEGLRELMRKLDFGGLGKIFMAEGKEILERLKKEDDRDARPRRNKNKTI